MTDTIGSDSAAGYDSGQEVCVTANMARFVVDTSFEDLPGTIVMAIRNLVLDQIAVVAAAYDTRMARALYGLFGERGGAPEATLIADGRRIPAAAAAYVHAQLANLLEADETMHNRMHAFSVCGLAGLAVAEMTGASGRELLTAIAVGYDVAARVGISLQQFVPDGHGGMRLSPQWGYGWMTLGAAATAARLLGLDAEATAHALGQAHVTTPVYFDLNDYFARLASPTTPAMWHKYQLSGAMAEAGINAAELASRGWKSRDDLLDAGSGFWRSYNVSGCDYEQMYAHLGIRWYVGETSIRPYPFPRHGQGALDLLAQLIAQHGVEADEIDEIVVRIAPTGLSQVVTATVHPSEPLKLIVSQPTALALVALRVPPGPKWFNADLEDPLLRRIAARVRYEVVESWGAELMSQMDDEGFFARLPTEVVVRRTDGTVLRSYTEYLRGDPWTAQSAFSFDDVADKARGYLDGILPTDRIEQLITAVAGVAQASDLSAIAAAMVAAQN